MVTMRKNVKSMWHSVAARSTWLTWLSSHVPSRDAHRLVPHIQFVELLSSTAFSSLVDEKSISEGRHPRKLADYGREEIEGDGVESVYFECRPLPHDLLKETERRCIKVSQQAGSVVSYEAIIEDYLHDSNPATTSARLRSQYVRDREVGKALSTSSHPVNSKQA